MNESFDFPSRYVKAWKQIRNAIRVVALGLWTIIGILIYLILA